MLPRVHFDFRAVSFLCPALLHAWSSSKWLWAQAGSVDDSLWGAGGRDRRRRLHLELELTTSFPPLTVSGRGKGGKGLGKGGAKRHRKIVSHLVVVVQRRP